MYKQNTNLNQPSADEPKEPNQVTTCGQQWPKQSSPLKIGMLLSDMTGSAAVEETTSQSRLLVYRILTEKE